mmetsp:Transcript_8159/g.10805  ORF Transcript_8159/g.10805 Transcript_8159/m.10805 type:complete len:150 (+) Transcript_8159:29-478(+)|eukprot:CAMPEP_0117739848 /NCGR_PEP_ID=MMETSP0947-20121206/4002_1 /TAXON_ID=44440 /ORGANISM="Chattonella subsalsa, Strain CCMP2191" /LENGTH=149 /DNA_ID=CAMNT_0005555873 /DNA_START=19 /DNA_END=468 /DNA_ORIENTATION=-
MDEKKQDDYEENVGSKAEWNRDELLEGAIKYVDSSMKESLDNFLDEKAHIFREVAEEKAPEDEEHKLEYSQIHAEYLKIFERILEEYIDDQGCTIQDFWMACKDAIEDKYCALFEEHEHHWFVDSLLVSLEYQKFFELMIEKARIKYDL